MGFTVIQRNAWLDALAPSHVSLHTGPPGETGAAEVTGGAPAYARKAITMAAAAAGNRDSSTAPVFDVPAGTTITDVGFWTAVTAGIFLGSNPVTDEVFAAQGQYSLTDADLSIA